MQQRDFLASLMTLSLLCPVLACDGDDDESTSDAGDGDSESGSTGDGDSGDGDGDSGDGDASGCMANCAAVDACAPDSYAATESFNDLESCVEYCEGQFSNFDADGCGAEQAAVNTCVAALECEDIVSFLGDPVAANVCTAEIAAFVACVA
jgi:hypothetical protein